jgi:hypothetical protein
MLDLIRDEINNHPIVSSACVKFLAMYSPIGEVRKLQEEFKMLNLLVKTAQQAEAKKAVNVASEAAKKLK